MFWKATSTNSLPIISRLSYNISGHTDKKKKSLLFRPQSWRQTKLVSWSSQCHLCRVRLDRRWDPRCFPELLACRLVRPHIICLWIFICAVSLIPVGMAWARQRKEGEVEQFLLNCSSWAWRKDLRSKNISPHQTGRPTQSGVTFLCVILAAVPVCVSKCQKN